MKEVGAVEGRAAKGLEFPRWARMTEKRRQHVARVTALLDDWARALGVEAAEARMWHNAGAWHDALRDAPEAELRALTQDYESPVELLHGPAAAIRLEHEGETRPELLAAIRWHTVGHPGWARTGRALFLADYLEPGRRFAVADRAFLAAHVLSDFDGVFRQVVRLRLEWIVRDGMELVPELVALWNRVR